MYLFDAVTSDLTFCMYDNGNQNPTESRNISILLDFFPPKRNFYP